MPIIFKLGFAFNIFEKNTIFIVDMPQVLDEAPIVGSNKDMHYYNNNLLIMAADVKIDNRTKMNPFQMINSPAEGDIIREKGKENINGDIVHMVRLMENGYNYTADMMFTVLLSDIVDEDNVKVYRYNGGELLELTSVQKGDQIVFFTDRLGDFVFIKNK